MFSGFKSLWTMFSRPIKSRVSKSWVIIIRESSSFNLIYFSKISPSVPPSMNSKRRFKYFSLSYILIILMVLPHSLSARWIYISLTIYKFSWWSLFSSFSLTITLMAYFLLLCANYIAEISAEELIACDCGGGLFF